MQKSEPSTSSRKVDDGLRTVSRNTAHFSVHRAGTLPSPHVVSTHPTFLHHTPPPSSFLPPADGIDDRSRPILLYPREYNCCPSRGERSAHHHCTSITLFALSILTGIAFFTLGYLNLGRLIGFFHDVSWLGALAALAFFS